MPPLEDFLNVWAVAYETEPGEGATEQEKKAYKYRWELLEWYIESYLPKTTADSFFGATVRPVKRVSGTVLVDKVQMECMPVLNEAYGQLQYENSRESWIAKFEFKRTHKRKGKIPNYTKKDHENTKKYKCKWSDAKDGQGCKWDVPLALATLNQREKTVEEWRANDASQGYIAQDVAIKISKKALDWEKKEAKLANKNKRAREEDNQEGDVAMVEEEEEEFTGHKWDEIVDVED